jgi:hypothetical protein
MRWKVWLRSFLQYTGGDVVVGVVEYLIHPDRGVAWGGPFNGQRYRQDLFKSLVTRVAPVAIVETGTFLGTTTDFMARTTGLPTFSVEPTGRHYGFALARLWRSKNVHLLRGDSRTVLRILLEGPIRQSRNRNVFVYLDAHWNGDHPLIQELEIVFDRCPNAIVMVDDFHVPFDAGYGYDSYGTHLSLVADYIESIIAAHSLRVFYPSTPSVQETGARRGCVVLVKSVGLANVLTFCPLLRESVLVSMSRA